MMSRPLFTLDVFTETRFTGNPLAVVLDADGLPSPAMQSIARELNLSETVFVGAPGDPANTARVRIFTPVKELPFAGHPTIGCAALLAMRAPASDGADETIVRLEQPIGVVPVRVRGSRSEAPYAELTAIALPETAGVAPPAEAIAAALGLTIGDIGFGPHRPAILASPNRFLFVPLASRDALARARVECEPWARIDDPTRIGAYLYCAGAPPIDFHARLFAPSAGIAEDPATGSAAATFPGVLAVAGVLVEGTQRWILAQGEDMGRPSRITVEADVREARIAAARVGGHAVLVTSGSITT